MDYRIKSRPKIPRNKYGYLTNTSTGNFSSDENNNIAGGGDKNLDMHKLWGNDFNGTQDVNGAIHFTDDAYIEFKDGSFHFSKGIWSDDFVSAFGQSSGGGGDGGVYYFTDLEDIKDLNFGANDANKTIVWNGSDWVKSSIGGGGGDTNVQSDWAEVDSNSDAYIKNKPALSDVAYSGNYNDLSNTPSLSDVAYSGSYNDLSNTPYLASVAYSGSYDDLYDTPNLSTVAISGDYNDLNNKITQTTISNWGFTKNIGTVTSVKVGSNGTTYSPSNGVVTIPSYPTLSSLGAVSTTTFNAHNHDERYVTGLSTSGNNLTWTKNGTTNKVTVPFAISATTSTMLQNSSRDAISTRTFTKTDNGGWWNYILIADVTDWQSATQNAPNRGVIGTIYESRTNNGSYLVENIIHVICRCSYSNKSAKNYNNEKNLFTTSDDVIPRIILYNKKYYLALAIRGGSRTFTMIGRFVNCYDEFRELKRVSETSTTWFEGAEENRTKSAYTVTVLYDELGVDKLHNKLQIGNALLSYDSSNNSLKVENVTSTTPMNLYATGGVSALGANGSTTNPQFDSVNVANGVTAGSLTASTVNATNLKIGQYCQNISNIVLSTETSGTYIYFNYGSSRYRFQIERTGDAT